MSKPREYLKKMRTDMSLTQQDMANAFGISKQYYNLIELGVNQKNMDLTMVRRIADVFGKTLDDIARHEEAWAAENEAEAEKEETA